MNTETVIAIVVALLSSSVITTLIGLVKDRGKDKVAERDVFSEAAGKSVDTLLKSIDQLEQDLARTREELAATRQEVESLRSENTVLVAKVTVLNAELEELRRRYEWVGE